MNFELFNQQQPPPPAAAAAAATSSSSSSKPASKPIGMACRACRLRKIRCGGERPRCSYCVKKGYDCVLTPHKKRGRPRKSDQSKSKPKPATTAVKSIPIPAEEPPQEQDVDVRQLWAELTELDLPPELSALAANLSTQWQEGVPSVGGPQLGMADGGLQHMAVDPMFASFNYAFPQDDNTTSLSSVGLPLPPVTSQSAMSPGAASSSVHSDQQTQRPVALAQSSAAIPECEAVKPPTSTRKRAKKSATTASASRLVVHGLPVSNTVDEGVRLYFIYVHPWLPILHRPTFEKQIEKGQVDPLLYYAVQAIAARFKESNTKRPYRKGQRYARAAREILPQSLKNTNLSTLQALAILSLYMAVSGQWQEGAAYEKLAVQLAFIGQYHLLDEEFLLPPVTNNMGLYESGWSEHSHPARLEVLSRPGGVLEHEQRRRCWWSIFQLERFNGLAMGRPPIIKPGWHWVWLPCSEELWAQQDPSGRLAWEMGLAESPQRAPQSVSNCRVDLILALVMGQLVEQRTEMFRLFFPRVDTGTLFYDNLPTHSLSWPQRLRRLVESVGQLERKVRQWHGELDRYADAFSARRHANFEVMGASCQIHLYACVLQIREHLFEDLLVGQESTGKRSQESGDQTPLDDAGSSRTSSVDLSAMFEKQTGIAIDRAECQRGYMAKAKRPPMSMEFVKDLDELARKCWDRSVVMSDEIARLLRVHWLRPFDQSNEIKKDVFEGHVAPPTNPPQDKPPETEEKAMRDPLVADRFKLMNPQTPYHLFVAGKVQAARLKQAVTAQTRTEPMDMDIKGEWEDSPEVVREAVSRINEIWHKQGEGADVEAIKGRLDDIVSALEYCQLFWYSLNFASHLKYLKREAMKPLLHNIYRR